MPDLALRDEFTDSAGDVFDGHIGIDPVLVMSPAFSLLVNALRYRASR